MRLWIILFFLPITTALLVPHCIPYKPTELNNIVQLVRWHVNPFVTEFTERIEQQPDTSCTFDINHPGECPVVVHPHPIGELCIISMESAQQRSNHQRQAYLLKTDNQGYYFITLPSGRTLYDPVSYNARSASSLSSSSSTQIGSVPGILMSFSFFSVVITSYAMFMICGFKINTNVLKPMF